MTEKLLILEVNTFFFKVKQFTNVTVCGARGYWPCKQVDNISIEKNDYKSLLHRMYSTLIFRGMEHKRWL